MTLIDALRFVKGAIAKKDFSPALTHYSIAGRRVKSFNGGIALSCPIPLDLDIAPKADVFYRAIEACRDGVSALNMTSDGRLCIFSGPLKIHVECLKEGYPNIAPEGTHVALKGDFLSTVETLAPFIAEDASRPWARGILFRGPSAFATNNVILIEKWLGYNFPVEINIPEAAVKELLRIGEEPTSLQVAEASVTFHYKGDRWLRAQNSPTAWPDVGAVLDRDSLSLPIPSGFFDAVEALEPFADDSGHIYIREGRVSTAPSDDAGATHEVPDVVSSGLFNAGQLLALRGVAETIDFSLYPSPCLFFGDNVRGAIVGMNL